MLGLICSTPLLLGSPKLGLKFPSLRVLLEDPDDFMESLCSDRTGQPQDDCSLTLPSLRCLMLCCWTRQSFISHQLQVCDGGVSELPKVCFTIQSCPSWYEASFGCSNLLQSSRLTMSSLTSQKVGLSPENLRLGACVSEVNRKSASSHPLTSSFNTISQPGLQAPVNHGPFMQLAED